MDDSRPRGATGFFETLRIVELGTWLSVPAAAALFADRGAEVIKVEPPRGDPGRNYYASETGANVVPPTFLLDNRSKSAVSVDLQNPEGRHALRHIVAAADVFITNMRLDALERFGLDHEALLAANPRLVYASLTGFGLRGPQRSRPSYDIGAFWARSGLSHQLTVPGAAPTSPAGGYGDHITALALFGAITAGLLERERTGSGGLVETSLLRTGAWVAGGDLAVMDAIGKLHPAPNRADCRTPLVNSYRTSDNRWFFLVGVETMRHFGRVCEAIDRPELNADNRFSDAGAIRRNARELVEIFDVEFGKVQLAEWAARFERAGVWWEPVANPAEVLADEQLLANDAFAVMDVDGSRRKLVASPFTVFERALTLAAPPVVGADNYRYT